LGYNDYRKEMEAKYPENAWVTPSELFKPFYGYAVANYMLTKLDDRKTKNRKL
jgi:SAM-dependent MidA family methyltransferase